MEIERSVICRPLGGLNDMLAQIARTDAYARRTGRKLFIDTESNPKFAANLLDYFECDVELQVMPKAALERFDSAECFPVELTGRISTYELLANTQVPFRDSTSQVPVTFDFGKNYPERVLIHHQPGGGLNSTSLLKRMTLNARILAEVERRKAILGPNYAAVHIRDSDYETQWVSQLSNLKRYLSGRRVFLATDNHKIPDSPELKGLDLDVEFSSSFECDLYTFDKNEQSLIDLALLAEAAELYILKLNHLTVPYSGFSLLAKYLWSVRKLKRDGLVNLLRAKSLFKEFQGGTNALIRITYFYSYWLPRLLRASLRSDFLGP